MSKKLNEPAFARLQELSRLKLSKRGAAKILYDEDFGFTSIEHARTFVRGHTMAKGAVGRDNITWITDVPTPLESEFNVIEIPKETDGIGLLADIHIPFQDKRTIDSFLERKDEYEVVVFLGDVFDFHSISRFSKHKTIDIAKEQEDWWQLMDYMRDQIPDKKIYFLQGNHDDRFWVYIMRQARELEHLQGMEFETIFGLSDYNVELLPMRNIMHYRELFIGHGHELNCGGVPVNPARTFYLKTGGNFIGGHFHRSSYHPGKDIGGSVKACWSVGCACDLRPLYAPVNQWNNGYAIVRPYGDDEFRVKNITLW